MPRKMSESSVGLSEALIKSLIRVTPHSGGSILDQGSSRAGPWQGFEVGGGKGRMCLARVRSCVNHIMVMLPWHPREHLLLTVLGGSTENERFWRP